MKTTKKMEATKTMETTKVMRTIYLLFISLFLLAGNLPAQDWANLKQFQNDNAALGAPAKGEKRVVFMGNSITIVRNSSRIVPISTGASAGRQLHRCCCVSVRM